MNLMLSANRDSNIKLLTDIAHTVYDREPILADITVAQAILESRLLGKPSQLAVKYNNLFGIKGKGTAGSVVLPTKEDTDKGMITVNQEFAWNVTLMDSIKQHKRLLEKDRYTPVRMAKTFAEAAFQLQKCGYATDRRYPELLIDIYNNWIK